MLSGISGISPSYMVSGISPSYTVYTRSIYAGAMRANAIHQGQAARETGPVAAVTETRAANLETPVEPVRPVSPVDVNGTNGVSYMIPFLREGMDPAELAVRMRIRYVDPFREEDGPEAEAESTFPGIKDARQVMEEGECQTCENRKYQDGSDDPGVSFKTPTNLSPEQAAAAVRGHEQEHVVREQAEAARENRHVVSQSVTLHTDICPECGRVYVSGGVTRTTTAADTEPENKDNR